VCVCVCVCVCLHVSIEPLLCHACKRKVFADLDGMRNQPFWIIPLIDEGKIESTSEAKTRKVNTENTFIPRIISFRLSRWREIVRHVKNSRQKDGNIYVKSLRILGNWNIIYVINVSENSSNFWSSFPLNFAFLLDFSCWWKSWYLENNIRCRTSI